MRWWKRYEPLLEAKPVSGAEAVRDLIAKELVELYEGFPPRPEDVSWEDANLEHKYRAKLPDLPRLDVPLVDMITRIVVLDLQHEIEAVDHLIRNDHHRAAAHTQGQLDALMFVWRVVIEHLESRKEEANGILQRKDLPDIAGRAAQRFRARAFRARALNVV